MPCYELDIEPILEEDPLANPTLMRVVVGDLVGSRRDINKIFKLTKDLNAVHQIGHLRRVRDTDDGRIECVVSGMEESPDGVTVSDEDCITKIREILEGGGVVLKDYRIIEVPSGAARTEAQVETYSKIWPVKFSKSVHLIKCIEGSIIDQAERLVLQIIVNGLVDHLKSTECKSTSGAVIFRYAQVYGQGFSCCATLRSNPTKHSPMIAIDSVARNAGAGHWPAETHSSGDELASKLQNLLDDKPELADHKMEPDFLPYICTNYDIVITEEPCMMCTMALIQSRIRRVFYLDAEQIDAETTTTGSFKPVCYPDKAIEEFFIHRDKSINHRFEAWRIKLKLA